MAYNSYNQEPRPDRIMYLDIETVPAGEESIEKLEYLYKRAQSKKKKKSVDNDNPDNPEDTFEAFVNRTGFEGDFGRIACIALAVGDSPVYVYSNCDKETNELDEKKTLEKFWEIAAKCDLFVGHNIIDFDMRFIYQRSWILGVKPSKDLTFARYRSNPMYDTMKEWGKWSNQPSIGLERLALALGIPTPKDDIDGSQVAAAFNDGRIDDICTYCKKDVETTRAIYKRMAYMDMGQKENPSGEEESSWSL